MVTLASKSSVPAPQRVDEEKLVELVAVRTRNLADDILAQADLTAEEALNDDERQVIALLDCMFAANLY